MSATPSSWLQTRLMAVAELISEWRRASPSDYVMSYVGSTAADGGWSLVVTRTERTLDGEFEYTVQGTYKGQDFLVRYGAAQRVFEIANTHYEEHH